MVEKWVTVAKESHATYYVPRPLKHVTGRHVKGSAQTLFFLRNTTLVLFFMFIYDPIYTPIYDPIWSILPPYLGVQCYNPILGVCYTVVIESDVIV